MINTLQDLFALYDATDKEQLRRKIYRLTDCGASIQFRDNDIAVQITSIVEGSDAEVSSDWLIFPFSEADWQQAVEYVEGEADILYRETNDDDEEDS
jgi:hypothetical protein